jgi:hypothetical protein
MKDGILAQARRLHVNHSWMGFRALESAVVLAQVSELLAAVAHELTPSEVLTAVCEAMARPVSLTNAVLFKRLAGQSRTLAWSAPDVDAASRATAREQAWTSAAALLDGQAPAGGDAAAASVSVIDEHLGLSAMLYVESRRALDAEDRELLGELLRQMVCLPTDR